MPGIYSEFNVVTALMPSGSTTSSGVLLRGFTRFSLLVPTLTSAVLSFVAPTSQGGTLTAFRTQAGAIITAQPTAGTGAMWLDSNTLSFAAGNFGPVHISAAAAQAADRNFVWHMKG